MPFLRMSPRFFLVCLLVSAGCLSGCLKSRSQLRDEEASAPEPIPADIREVNPKGTSNLYAMDEIRAELAQLQGRVEELERSHQAQQTTLEGLEKQLKLLEVASTPSASAPETAPALPPDEIVFNRAEAFFGAKEFRKAILDYSTVTEKHPKSARVPTALWKIGLSFEALQMKEDAKAFFQDLVDKFPKSPEAKAAKTKLKAPPVKR